jgi:hypothetical protein
MNEGNITVTLTESQHELINEILHHALDTFQLVAPYDDGLYDIPMECFTNSGLTVSLLNHDSNSSGHNHSV